MDWDAHWDIPFDGIVEALRNHPEKDMVDCDACHGAGEVDYCFDHDDTSYYHTGDCPICDGAGDKQQEQDAFSFYGRVFYRSTLEGISHIASATNDDKVVMRTSPTTNHCTFVIGEVELLSLQATARTKDSTVIC